MLRHHLTQFHRYLPRDSTVAHGWGAPSHKTAPLHFRCQLQAQVVTYASAQPATKWGFQGPPPAQAVNVKSRRFTRTSNRLAISQRFPETSMIKPPLGFDYLARAAHGTREIHVLPAYYKRMPLRGSRAEETHKARLTGRDTELPCSRQAHPSPQMSTHSPTRKLSKLSLWVFTETSLQRHS